MGKNELPDQVRVTFQLERGEYIRGVRYYLRKSHLVSWVQVLVMLFALAATVTVTLMMGRLNFLNTLVLVLMAMAALYGLWLYWIKPGRIFDREAELAEPVTFLFTQEDVARQDERVHLELRLVDDGLERAGHVLVSAEHAEVLEAGRGRALDGHGHQRRGGFEAHAHEHDLAIGVLLGQSERVQRRVHDLHAAARRLLGEQA